MLPVSIPAFTLYSRRPTDTESSTRFGTASMTTPTATTARPFWQRPLHPVLLSAMVTLLLCLFYNGPLWRLILEQPYSSALDRWLFAAAFFSFIAAIMQLFLGALAWPRLVKPLAIFLLISAASINYFMESYGILIDKTMVQNLFETDTAEATDLLSLQLLLHLLLKGILPAAVVFFMPLQRTTLKSQLTAQSLSLFCCLTLIGLNAAVLYKDYSLAVPQPSRDPQPSGPVQLPLLHLALPGRCLRPGGSHLPGPGDRCGAEATCQCRQSQT